MNTYIWFFGCISILCGSIVIIYLAKKKQERYLYGIKGPSKKNKLLKDILNTAFTKKTIKEACAEIVEKLNEYFNLEYISLFSFNYKTEQLSVISSNINVIWVKDIENYATAQFKAEIIRKGGSKSAGVIECCKEDYLPYASADKREIKYAYLLPLFSGSELTGALLIESKKYEPDGIANKQEHDFFKTVQNYVSVAFQALLYYQKIQHIAWYDSLTEIHNRAFMWEDLGNRLKNKEENSIACIAFFDIDKFKVFNDTHGHETGDVVLKAVSNEIKCLLRECDEVYRYGGEEFIIYIDNLNSIESYTYVDNIRGAIEKMKLQKGDGTLLKVTLSFGIAEFPKDSNSIEKVINYADDALYVSKNTGRNKVTIYQRARESEDSTNDNK